MITTVKDKERRRLGEVAQDYREKGYEVVVEPDAPSLPEFLAGYRPDLIAHNGKDNVVVEVKSYPSLVESNDLSQLAQDLQQHPGWRLELIVPPLMPDPMSVGPSVNKTDILERLTQAHQMLREGYARAALLITLSAVESAVRLLGKEGGTGARSCTASGTLRHLNAQESISRQDYAMLRKALTLRNAVSHGRTQVTPDAQLITEMISTTRRLLEQSQHSRN